ncbi:MAG: tyrosine-type recombinase/integrase [Phycisphaerales bacterium]|nr:tyrosine-type recombinase/integrase [Phycisphaerales bacterium]
MERRVYLTNDGVAECRSQAAQAGEPLVFTDDRLKGFLLKVSGDTATFYVQREVGGKTVRVALGRAGGKRTASDFRDLAEKVRGELGDANTAAKAGDAAEVGRIVARVRDRLERDGAPQRRSEQFDPSPVAQVNGDAAQVMDPAAQAMTDEAKWRALTLAQAMEEHFAKMRRRDRARSVGSMGDEMTRYLGEWMERPIAGITRTECVDRHGAVCDDHGGTVANKAFRNLRAVWNTAASKREADENYGAVNPVRRFGDVWHEEAKGKPIEWEALPEWAAQVNAIRNSVRCDWYWFVALSALRSLDARTLRWDQVNLTDKQAWYVNAAGERVSLPAKSMHRPCPKGGERKAFTVPLSAPAVEILKRRKAENAALFGDDDGWVFPARDKSGGVIHLSEPKQQDYRRDAEGRILRFKRNKAGEWVPDPKGQPRKFTALANPHRLRHTFASTGDEEGVNVSERVMKGLMNHTPDSTNMNHRYNRPSMDAMRAATEKVSAFLIRKAGTVPAAANPAALIVPEDRKAKRASA